jgi:cyclopropane fatty-acyl-phospholipid synthase-like methyltransferase
MWDQRYSEEGFAYGTAPNDFLVAEYEHIRKGGRVLSLAEGEGRNAVFLAREGYQVTGVDQSMVGLNKAQQLAAEQEVQIKTIHSDLADYDPGVSCWDAVISLWAHLPSELCKELYPRVVNSLKSGGILILESYTLDHLDMEGVGGPPAEQKDRFTSLEALKRHLKGLEFIIGHEIEREVSEGKYHQGASAVVQVVARKS